MAGPGIAGVSSRQTVQNMLPEQLRAIIDSIPSLAWRASSDGGKDFLNVPWLDYTGLTVEEAVGWGWKAVIHPDDLNRLLREWQAIFESGMPGEMEARFRRFDGVYRWFLIRAIPKCDQRGKVLSWFGTNTDIDDRKRAVERLERSEQELRGIADAIPHAIVVQDPNGKPCYANRVTLEYTGLSIEDVLAEGFRERIFHPDDLARNRDLRDAALNRGEPFEIEQRAMGNDGQYRWFLIRYNPLVDQEGRIIRWYATGTDIDDRKQNEERLRNENLALREEVDWASMFEEIVGSSDPIRRVLKQVSRVAPSESTVLILGETGTGKELIARALHRQSNRSARAFVRVNCAAIPQALIASELFGHERGAFTGAQERRVGRFELANEGTLFLDEIGDLPAETQIALLRVLQEREFEPIGGNRTIKVNVRIIAATNRDLAAAVATGDFRQDLFYRLNVFPIQVPSLRQRVADIPVLVEYFVSRYAKSAGKKIKYIGNDTMKLLREYEWPGNIRELQNVVERAVILSENSIFFIDESWVRGPSGTPARAGSLTALVDQEVKIIEAALAECGGRISGPSGAAAKLGIPRQTLESKIRSLGIDKPRRK